MDIFRQIRNQKTLIVVNPTIHIYFNNKEIPFFEYLRDVLGVGSIYKIKGNNSVYTIAVLDRVFFIINMINGKFGRPKIYCLYKAIDLINLKYNLNKEVTFRQ